jgi:hypothetical protein
LAWLGLRNGAVSDDEDWYELIVAEFIAQAEFHSMLDKNAGRRLGFVHLEISIDFPNSSL